jgi:hypothetical protein
MAIEIRNNEDIKGIEIDDKEIRISQLADDTVCFCRDDTSLENTLKVFDSFKKVSGLTINMEKTKVVYIGILKNKSNAPRNLDCSSNIIETLGIKISGKEKDHYRLNYAKKIDQLKVCLNLWKMRQLSLKGKITIINNMAIAPLLYLASCITTPPIVVKEVKELITNFIWDNKPPKIAYKTLIQSIGNGGLKLIDFETKVKALKITWIKRLINSQDEAWTSIPKIHFKEKDLNIYFKYRQRVPNYNLEFYQEVHNAWFECQQNAPLNKTNILNTIIWNNLDIKISKKTINWKIWKQKGI